MYLILIYIVLVFIILITDNIIEGQEVVTNNKDLPELYRKIYEEEISEDDIKEKQIEINFKDKDLKLKIYLTLTVKDLKNMIKDEYNMNFEDMEIIYDELILRDDYMLMGYGIREGSTLDVINNNELYKGSELFKKLYGYSSFYEGDPENNYKEYLRDFLKYNKTKYVESDRLYSKKLSRLLNRSSKSYLKAYNRNHYLSDDINEELNKQDNLAGPNPYIYSSDLYNRILQKDINKELPDNKEDNCCFKVNLEIANPILVKDNLSNMIMPEELLYENSIIETIESSNDNYYDYMDTGKNIFKYLEGSMKNYLNPGRISYK